MRYELDRLGWLEFENLIKAVLKQRFGAGIEMNSARADGGREAHCETPLAYPGPALKDGPFTFQCKFVEGANAAGSRPRPALHKAVDAECAAITERLKRVQEMPWLKAPRHYALLTNADCADTTKEEIRAKFQAVMPETQIHVHGGTDVCAWIDAAPQLVVRFPQLFSLADFRTLLQAELARDVKFRSQVAVDKAETIAGAFVPTKPHQAALAKLDEHRFVILEGPPEMGKTSIARMIALSLFKEGWEAIECRHPQEVQKAYDREAKQVFVCDDCFGSTDYRPERVGAWQDELPYILHIVDATHRLILTSRAHLWKMAVSHFVTSGSGRRFPGLGEVVVNAADLPIVDKARILYRHAKLASLPDDLRSHLREAALGIVKNPHFTPERVRLLMSALRTPPPGAAGPALKSWVIATAKEVVDNPTTQMATTFDSLPLSHQWLLFSLLDCGENLSILTAKELERRFETHCPPAEVEPFAKVVSQCTEAFIRTQPGGVIDWIHPTCRDLAVKKLGDHHVRRRAFLLKCSLPGIRVAVALGAGREGESNFPLLRSDDDWDIISARLTDRPHRESLRLLAATVDTVREQGLTGADSLRGLRLTVLALLRAARTRQRQEHDWDIEMLSHYLSLRSYLNVPLAAPGFANIVRNMAEKISSGASRRTVRSSDLQKLIAGLAKFWSGIKPGQTRLKRWCANIAVLREALDALIRAAEEGEQNYDSAEGDSPDEMDSVAEDLANVAAAFQSLNNALPDDLDDRPDFGHWGMYFEGRSESWRDAANDKRPAKDEGSRSWSGGTRWEPEVSDHYVAQMFRDL